VRLLCVCIHFADAEDHSVQKPCFKLHLSSMRILAEDDEMKETAPPQCKEGYFAKCDHACPSPLPLSSPMRIPCRYERVKSMRHSGEDEVRHGGKDSRPAAAAALSDHQVRAAYAYPALAQFKAALPRGLRAQVLSSASVPLASACGASHPPRQALSSAAHTVSLGA
jgi:hypothetical protein